MTALADLEPIYPATSSQVLAVGWLERGHSYPTGPIPEAVFRKLEELFQEPFQLAVAGGSHGCTLCQFRPERSGTANLFVPGDGILYLCPELILHYVNAHAYTPPAEFCSAVLRCPGSRSIAYKRLFLANGGRALVRAGRLIAEPGAR